MAELKTKPTEQSVEAFLNNVPNEKQREDAFEIMALMRKITKAAPKMWGPSIIGFGDYRCKYESGRELDWFITGFSPRKQSLTLYLMSGLQRHDELLKKLGKHKTGKGCLYIKSLKDVDMKVLENLIKEAVKSVKAAP